MNARGRSERRGFTLLELMLSMALVGFVLLGARLLFAQVIDTKTIILRDAARADSLHNGERMARAMFLTSEVTPDTGSRFIGNELNVTFTTWCRASGGWIEQCRVALLLDHRTDSTALVAHFSPTNEIELLRRPGRAVFRYLDRSAADTNWFESWGTNIRLPDAVAMVSNTDTVIFVAGGNGG